MQISNIFSVIKKRTSIRNYMPDQISEQDLHEILEACI